ncbi:M6 family metalloprotease domain-containing protein [Geomonas sp. RF6]|uniref:M6 family metalloprotease domain-containing protein n=1 Tax=Geomonas sp. RF6 TaxID=2897342 RepID=UPI001E482A59|nr:M6 family metalloprotease domain-containing protein [Geomonas sp. RF6]UFS69080.1 M6 family metalloprotease domain-containing protein [Geomonas sp. RF6]
MKKSILTAARLLVAASSAFAGPAVPETTEVRQPDGTSFKAKPRGDEFQHWLESTETGHTVLRNPRSGVWEYAEQAPDGTLQTSNIKVVPGGRNAPSFIPAGVKPRRDTEREKRHLEGINKMYQQRLKETGAAVRSVQKAAGTTATASSSISPSSGWTVSPVSGSKKLLIVLVNFSDRTMVTTPQQWYDAVFSTTAGVKSVANYYKDNSFGKLAITPVPHTQSGKPAGVVTVNLAMPHEYNGTSEEKWVAAALNQADQYVRFSTLDTDGDRLLERNEAVVYFVVAGYEQSGSSRIPSVWAHAASYSSGGLSAAGIYFPVWARSGELNNSSVQHGIGVIAHELGHQLVGLPDLYDTAQRNAGLGAFSLMAAGSWGAAPGESAGTTPVGLDAWSREYTGWSTPLVPAGNSSVTLGVPLAAAGNTLKMTNTTLSATEYYLVENRRPQGWDLGMTSLLGSWSGGLLVEHVDNAMGTNQSGAAAHQGVVIAQAAKPCDMMTTPTCYGRQQTLFYSGNNTSFNATSTPSSAFYGGPSYRWLNSISVPGSSMTVAFSQPASTLTGTITINGTAQYTNTVSVTLGVSAIAPAPATVQQMSFSNDGTNWSGWQAYATTKAWVLAAGADGTRTVSARFRDASGTVSPVASDTITLDTSAPMAAITLANASNGGVTRNTSVSFTVNNAGVTVYRYKLDSAAWSGNVAAGTVTALSGLTNGVHTLYAIAGDAAGNWQSSASPTTVKWTIDTVAPTTTATPPGGSYAAAQTVTLVANESATIYYTTNGTTPTTASARYASPIAVPASTTLKYFAVDAAGNVEAVKTSSYVIAGNTVPTGTGTSTVTNSYTFTVSGTNVVAYKYSLDGGALSAETPVSQKIVLTNVRSGTHTLAVYAKSTYGVWSTVPTKVTWTVR